MKTKYNNILFVDTKDYLELRHTKSSLYKSFFFEGFKIIFVLIIIIYLPKSEFIKIFIIGLYIGIAFILNDIYKIILKLKKRFILKFQKKNQYIYISKKKYSIKQLNKILIIEKASNIEFDIIALYIKAFDKKYLIVEMSGYNQSILTSLANHLNSYLELPIERIKS